MHAACMQRRRRGAGRQLPNAPTEVCACVSLLGVSPACMCVQLDAVDGLAKLEPTGGLDKLPPDKQINAIGRTLEG